MKNREEFMAKLNNLIIEASQQGNQISVQEVEMYFSDMHLTEEQMELVYDYLLAQKVVVKGYIKMDKQEEKELVLSEAEEAYLKEYENDLKAFAAEQTGEREKLFEKHIQGDTGAQNRIIEIYLKKVVCIAKEMHHEDIFLGDLIQEGNVGLILGIAMLTDVATADQLITEQIRQAMQILIEEQTETAHRDKKMIEKVRTLDESITTLTEELGRKVTIDELAVYTGMTEEEIEDVLKLTGEDAEESEEMEEE